MMRISREEEHFIGRARPSVHGRVKVGFTKDGRITAIDMYTVCDNGSYDAQGDGMTSGRIASLMYQPPAMRMRGVSVITNTSPRVSQSQPGGFQGIVLMEPIMSKAARKLGIDPVDIHKINAPRARRKLALRFAASGPISPAASFAKRSTAGVSCSTGISARCKPSAAAPKSAASASRPARS